MGREFTLYVNVSDNKVYDQVGSEIGNVNASPFIRFKENISVTLQYLNSAPSDLTNLDVYTGFEGVSITSSAAVDNNYIHYDSGTLDNAESGAITSIVVNGLSNDPRAVSGTLLLINSAGDQESVNYTAWTESGGAYTFTVSATLTNSYLAGDEVRAKETPIIKTLDVGIDDTDKDTGKFIITLDADTQPFETLVQGRAEIPGASGNANFSTPIFEHQVFDGSSERIFVQSLGMRCINVIDDDGVIPPAPEGDFYSKTLSDARFVRQALSTAYSESVLLAGTERIFIRDGASSKQATLNTLADFVADTGTQVSVTDNGDTDIILGLASLFRKFIIELTLSDGTNYESHTANIVHDGTNVTVAHLNVSAEPDFILDPKPEPPGGITLSGLISTGNVTLRITVPTTTGKTIKAVYSVKTKIAVTT